MWTDSDVLAATECKAQFGWNRRGWENEFLKREKTLEIEHPGAQMFLLVLTMSNWGGFGDVPRVGRQCFVLSPIKDPRDPCIYSLFGPSLYSDNLDPAISSDSIRQLYGRPTNH